MRWGGPGWSAGPARAHGHPDRPGELNASSAAKAHPRRRRCARPGSSGEDFTPVKGHFPPQSTHLLDLDTYWGPVHGRSERLNRSTIRTPPHRTLSRGSRRSNQRVGNLDPRLDDRAAVDTSLHDSPKHNHDPCARPTTKPGSWPPKGGSAAGCVGGRRPTPLVPACRSRGPRRRVSAGRGRCRVVVGRGRWPGVEPVCVRVPRWRVLLSGTAPGPWTGTGDLGHDIGCTGVSRWCPRARVVRRRDHPTAASTQAPRYPGRGVQPETGRGEDGQEVPARIRSCRPVSTPAHATRPSPAARYLLSICTPPAPPAPNRGPRETPTTPGRPPADRPPTANPRDHQADSNHPTRSVTRAGYPLSWWVALSDSEGATHHSGVVPSNGVLLVHTP